jgi:glycosyltransferase involved in cell wall biosynthesis
VESLPNLLQDMDLGIIPNKRNMATELMLPVKMLEYAAIGIPVISARLKTIEHYFSENMVTYFEPENVESLANAILELYRDENKRQVQVINARKFIERYGGKSTKWISSVYMRRCNC